LAKLAGSERCGNLMAELAPGRVMELWESGDPLCVVPYPTLDKA